MESSFLSRATGENDLVALLGPEKLAHSELIWSFFCSALSSFKRESLLRPFPPQFVTVQNQKDFTSLTAVTQSIPKLRLVNVSSLDFVQRDLLMWVLSTRKFSLKLLTKTDENGPIRSAVANAKVKPTHMYQVDYDESASQKFSELAADKTVLTAFHGSRMPNFYSILHHGLIANMNKTAAFGEGTYLSSDLNVSLNWSPVSKPGFSGSAERMSCIAVCEVIEDPTGMKCSLEPSAGVNSSLSHGVPERYIIVTNDCLVRVKYLLIYAQTVKPPQWQLGGSVIHFVRDHMFLFLMLLYCGILVVVGLCNSRNFTIFMRKWSDLWRHEPSYDDL